MISTRFGSYFSLSPVLHTLTSSHVAKKTSGLRSGCRKRQSLTTFTHPDYQIPQRQTCYICSWDTGLTFLRRLHILSSHPSFTGHSGMNTLQGKQKGSNYRLPVHYCILEAISFSERGISILIIHQIFSLARDCHVGEYSPAKTGEYPGL